ncbi:peroxisomal membrane protein 13 [Musa acuminata AAA Group]|uniref:peroxisomal membrane protein 13 n=1 Tax=Musa acuminata AAA Group TaxID=214697 RepID=UPI0031DF404E
MGSNSPPPGTRPPKPWEGAVSSSGRAPFKPPSPGSTPDVVESSDARCREFLPSDIDPYLSEYSVHVHDCSPPAF